MYVDMWIVMKRCLEETELLHDVRYLFLTKSARLEKLVSETTDADARIFYWFSS